MTVYPNALYAARFNTQPPEGGWVWVIVLVFSVSSFNTQPPEGGWISSLRKKVLRGLVSTHSRLKAAGTHQC